MSARSVGNWLNEHPGGRQRVGYEVASVSNTAGAASAPWVNGGQIIKSIATFRFAVQFRVRRLLRASRIDATRPGYLSPVGSGRRCRSRETGREHRLWTYVQPGG